MTANDWTIHCIISAIRGKDEQTRHDFFRNTLTAEEIQVLALQEMRA